MVSERRRQVKPIAPFSKTFHTSSYTSTVFPGPHRRLVSKIGCADLHPFLLHPGALQLAVKLQQQEGKAVVGKILFVLQTFVSPGIRLSPTNYSD